MRLDFVSQRIVSQLDRFYDLLNLDEKGNPTTEDEKGNIIPHDGKFSKYRVGQIFFYDAVYDYLAKKELFNYSADIKNELWKTAQDAFEVYEKRRPSSSDEIKLYRYYKSYLAMKYLFDKLPERLFIYNEETGQKITRINLRP